MITLGYEISKDRELIGFTQNKAKPKKNALVVDKGEAHLLTVAPTGAGKGRSSIIPTCLTYPGSLIVLDPKGEAANVTAGVRRKLGKVYVIDPFKVSTNDCDHLNPLSMIVDELPLEFQGMMLAKAITGDTNSFSSDPYWDNMATDLISGAIIAELQNNRCLADFRKMLINGDVDYNLALLLDTKKDLNPLAFDLISTYLQVPAEKTRPCVLSTAQQYLSALGEPAVLESMSNRNAITTEEIIKGEQFTIYLVIPPNKLRAFKQVLRLWVTSLLNVLGERKSRPPIPTLFILDECGNLGRMEEILSSVTLMRSYGLRLWLFFQDFGQMKQLYPKDWTTLVNNCDVVQAFGIRNYMMAKETADIVGEFSAAELLKMDTQNAVVALNGIPAKMIKRVDYLKDKPYTDIGFSKNPFYIGPSEIQGTN